MPRLAGGPDRAPGAPLVRPRDPAAAARALLPLGVAAKAWALLPPGVAAKAWALLPLGAAAVALVLLLPAAAVDRLPIVVPIGLGLLLALSIARPPLGLIVVAALVPLSWWIIRVADLDSLRLAEALVLAVLAGTSLRMAFSPRRRDSDVPRMPAGVGPAATAVMAVTAASVVVELAPVQTSATGTWFVATDAASQLSRDYLYGTAAVAPGLVEAARLGEGVGLLLIIAAWSRRQPSLPRQLAVALLAGAAVAAAVNLSIGAHAILESGQPATMLLRELAGGRLTLHSNMANLRVTGEYFLMAACMGLGLVVGQRRPWLYRAATLMIATTVWIVGSRTQLGVAALIALAGGVIWLRRSGVEARWRRAAVCGALTAATLLPMAVVMVYSERANEFNRDAVRDDQLAELVDDLYAQTTRDVRRRFEFAATGVRIWATEPIFGVGAGRYDDLSATYSSPWLLRFYPNGENAHNNYLQIAAEFGAVGLAAFLWLLTAVSWNVWRALRTGPGLDPLLVGTSFGTVAFLIASLTSHPLLLGETAYPFWIASGLVLAIAVRRHAPAPARAGLRPAIGWPLAPVLLLVVTLPARIDGVTHELTRANVRDGLEGLSGVYALEAEQRDGTPYRWTSPRATFFAPGSAYLARIPLRAPHAGPGRQVTVDIAIDGRRVMSVPMFRPDWIEVAAPLAGPRSSPALARIDLIVDPPWRPHERGNGDPRTLGVMIGAIAFTPSVPAPATVPVPVVR